MPNKSPPSWTIGTRSLVWPKQMALLKGLFIVPTPIGHLEDISLRALMTLMHADEILCEDTRVTRALMAAYGITPSARLTAFHEHNAKEKIPYVLERLEEGARIALVSDAGTPLIADPGHNLVQSCIAASLPVTALPGPCAALVAWVGSGLASSQNGFLVYGFLPHRSRLAYEKALELSQTCSPIILYEAPHRIERTLSIACQIWGKEHPAVLARELTKRYEEVWRGSLASLHERCCAAPPKGEIVLCIDAKAAPPPADIPSHDTHELLLSLARKPFSKEALRPISKTLGMTTSELYARLLDMRKQLNSEDV